MAMRIGRHQSHITHQFMILVVGSEMSRRTIVVVGFQAVRVGPRIQEVALQTVHAKPQSESNAQRGVILHK
jgi:hypothetical protein